jgi:preprotein translocase subunit YajC
VAHLITIGTILLVQTDTESEATSGFDPSFLILMLVVGAGLYFVMIAPARRRQKQVGEVQRGIDIGDEVRTVGGIYGVVTGATDDRLTIDVGGGTTLHIDRRAVGERLTQDIEDEADEAGDEDG